MGDVFHQDPTRYESDQERAAAFKVIPGEDAHGEPAVVLKGFRTLAFFGADEAYRIANQIADILEEMSTTKE